MKKLISIAILAAAMTAGAAQAQTTVTDANHMQVAWSDPSRPGLVQIDVMNGGITIKTHAGKEVLIQSSSLSRRVREQEAIVREGMRRIPTGGGGVVVEESNNVLTISNPNWNGGDNLEISVPVKTNLKLRSQNGSISVDGVDGDMDIQGQNGPVRLTNVSGSVVANAQNGRLTATVRELTPNRMMSFASMNQNVDVTLPATTKANVKIRSDNGSAWSDFDFQARQVTSPPVVTGGRGPRGTRIETDSVTNVAINGGGPEIELRSYNGSIFLRKAK